MKWLYDISYGRAAFDLCLPDVENPPLFLYFHGGGLEAGDKKDFHPQMEKLAEAGIAVASANYRMYPTARFPDYLEDAADCLLFIRDNAEKWGRFSRFFVGGSSAGGYISMMLYFDRSYLEKRGIDPDAVAGYVFDAGQPTTHYNVLRERGIDTRAIRVDEASPLYFISNPIENPLEKSRLLFLAADNDMACRLEQHNVLLRTLFAFGYSPARVSFKLMNGFSHCAYVNQPVFTDIIADFIQK